MQTNPIHQAVDLAADIVNVSATCLNGGTNSAFADPGVALAFVQGAAELLLHVLRGIQAEEYQAVNKRAA